MILSIALRHGIFRENICVSTEYVHHSANAAILQGAIFKICAKSLPLVLPMLLQPGAQFRGIGPVAAAPMGKIPLCIVRIALVIHIVKHAAPQDKIGGEVIDIQPGKGTKGGTAPASALRLAAAACPFAAVPAPLGRGCTASPAVPALRPPPAGAASGCPGLTMCGNPAARFAAYPQTGSSCTAHGGSV